MMRRTKAIVGLAVVVAVTFFFFVPVFYWFTFGPGVWYTQSPPHWNVYGSLGCITLGWGDIWSSQNGLQLNCEVPIVT
jgi:hypothetical protein